MSENWNIDFQSIVGKSQFKRLAKNHPREFASCVENLRRLCVELDAGKKVGAFSLGFFRTEGRGVYRIGQTKVPGAYELRLYVFPDEPARTVRVLCLGDKNTQQDDIQACHQLAATLKGNEK